MKSGGEGFMIRYDTNICTRIFTRFILNLGSVSRSNKRVNRATEHLDFNDLLWAGKILFWDFEKYSLKQLTELNTTTITAFVRH